MRANLNNYSDSRFLEPGVYDCFIYEVKDKTINDKNAIDVIFKDQKMGGTCKETFFMTREAGWRIKKLARAAGIGEDEFENFDTNDLCGHEITIKVDSKTGKDGKNYPTVIDFSSIKKDHQQPKQDDFPPKDSAWTPEDDNSQRSSTNDPF